MVVVSGRELPGVGGAEPTGDACWFCGVPAPIQHCFRAGLHRGLESKWIGPVRRDQWQVIDVAIPRCGRCRLGHYLEVLLLLAAIPCLAWGLGMILDTALGTYMALPLVPSTVFVVGVWFLPFVAWLSLRQGWFSLEKWFPRNRRQARSHPVVQQRLSEGWRYRRAPLLHWDRRWP